MKKFIHKGEEFETPEFETQVILGSGKEMEQIDALMREDEDTKSGKRKIKPIDKRCKPIKVD